MMGWEELHRLVDVIALLTAPAGIAGAAVLYLAWFRHRPRARRLIGWTLLVMALIFYAIDLADRFGVLPREEPQALIADVGLLPPNTYLMIVNTRSLRQNSDTHRLMICARLAYVDVDRMTDPNLDKTTLFTITGNQQTLGGTASNSLVSRLIPEHSYDLELDLILMPKDISPNQVTTLASVQRLGGTILGTKHVQTVAPGVSALPHSR
jgi:hypothetical protein